MKFFTAYDKDNNQYRFEITAEYEGEKRYFANLSTINNIATDNQVYFEEHGWCFACQNTIARLKEDVQFLMYNGKWKLVD